MQGSRPGSRSATSPRNRSSSQRRRRPARRRNAPGRRDQERIHDAVCAVVHVPDEEVARLREALGELGVDELVDHDPRCDDAAGQPVAEDCGDDDEAGEPGPNRNASEPAAPGRRLRRGPAVARQAEVVEAAASSAANGVPGSMPISAAACATSATTASATVSRRRPLRVPPHSPRQRARDRDLAGRSAGAHRSSRVASARSKRAARAQSASAATSSSSTGTFSATLVGQLREPAEVADYERPPERERADRAARRLPHRRRAQRDAGVARGHQ